LPIYFGDFVSQVGSYGNGNGSIYVGDGTQGSGIAVGSAGGPTLLFGDALNVAAGAAADAYAQVGYRPTAAGESVNSDLSLYLKSGGLSLQGGAGQGAYAQVGHGGLGVVDATLSGNVSVAFATAGDVEILAGTGAGTRDNYAQLGHGGAG